MTAAMLARVAFAVAAALSGGALLKASIARDAGKTTSSTGPPEGRFTPWLRKIVLGWCALWALIWLAIALARARYPFELEWAGGAMRDHCERILAGKPLYIPPGPDWFPFEYPPLYFWMCAALMRLLNDGTFLSMRLVSIVSTLGCAAVLYQWVRGSAREPTGRTWGIVAAGIFLATYRFTGAWYDIERLDMLFLFLCLLGGYWLTRATAKPDVAEHGEGEPNTSRRGVKWVILSAVAFWLAFLTKQQTVLFLVGSAAALLLGRRWRLLAIFAATSALLCVGSIALLNRSSHGWFGYYCFRVPLANGVRLNLAAQYFVTDLPLYAPLIALIAVCAVALRAKVHRDGPASRTPIENPSLSVRGCFEDPLIVWAAMGVCGSLLSRAHWGGDQNVLMAGFLGIILVGCSVAARAEAAMARTGTPLFLLVLAQLVTLVYRPDAQVPGPANRAAGERYESAVRNLERYGEVLCLDHGAMTKVRHFHLMGLLDVIGTEKGLPTRIANALRSKRFAAILTDAKPEPGGALDELVRDYVATECLRIETPWIATGFPTPSPGRQVWVLRRR